MYETSAVECKYNFEIHIQPSQTQEYIILPIMVTFDEVFKEFVNRTCNKEFIDFRGFKLVESPSLNDIGLF